MKLIITIKQHGHKPKITETPIGDLTLSELKKLWECEQFLNTLPGANLRVHVEVTE